MNMAFLWQRLKRSKKGFGMIEAAILMPLFLVLIFGGIDIGLMLLTQYKTTSTSVTLGLAIQQSPSLSQKSLEDIVKVTFPNNKNLCVSIQSYKEAPSQQTVQSLPCNVYNYGAPSDTVSSGYYGDASEIYYVGIKISQPYESLGIVSRLMSDKPGENINIMAVKVVPVPY
jgi:Flp pilus assembly protein TadG